MRQNAFVLPGQLKKQYEGTIARNNLKDSGAPPYPELYMAEVTYGKSKRPLRRSLDHVLVSKPRDTAGAYF